MRIFGQTKEEWERTKEKLENELKKEMLPLRRFGIKAYLIFIKEILKEFKNIYASKEEK